MPSRRFLSLHTLFGTILFIAALGAQAQTLNTLYTFPGGASGAEPVGPLVLDNSGNLYGVTNYGGITNSHCDLGCGTVYELSPNGSGGWTQTILYSFTHENGDGYVPYALARDSAGNLYGAASAGGYTRNPLCGSEGCGIVFELSPSSNGWTEKKLYSFEGFPHDGQNPSGNILIDKAGNLYGTTSSGGIGDQGCYGQGCGTVWELSPAADGSWKEKSIYNFLGVTYGGRGNLYAADALGTGTAVNGTIFEIKQ